MLSITGPRGAFDVEQNTSFPVAAIHSTVSNLEMDQRLVQGLCCALDCLHAMETE